MSNNNNTPIASCTGRILVVKDGKDGIGIKSADIVFAVYVDGGNAPSDDYEGWKTLYSQLTLTPDCFVWTATRITNTNDKSWLTGKRCLGKCEDFADIKELYALGDSNKDAPENGWSETYSPIKGKWLWTKNEITLQGVADKVYTDPVCVGYFGIDGINGTSFTPRGVADGHYDDAANIRQYTWGGVYLVDKDTKSTLVMNYPCVYTFLLNGNTSVRAAKGDAYRIDSNLWVNNGEVWVNFGNIQGPQGEDGENAPWALLSANPVVFESDEKGVAKSETKAIDVRVYLGSKIITSNCELSLVEKDNSNYDLSAASISNQGSETVTVSIPSDGINKKTVGGYKISYPNSSVTLKIAYEDYVFYVTINIVVDTSLVDGYFRTSINGLEAQYTKMNTTLTDQGALLTECQSNINVNAEAIKSKVAQTDYDESNKAVDVKFSEVNQRAESIEQSVTAVDKQGKETKSVLEQCVEKQDDGSYMSKMKMYADNITLSAGHVLNIQGDYLVVNTTNFKIDESGNVTLSGKVNAKSGSIGGFAITENNLHSSADGYSFDIYNDRLVYVDQKNSRTLSIMSDDTNGLRLSMGAAKDNSQCYITVGDRGIGLESSNGSGFKSQYNERCMSVAKDYCRVEYYIDTAFGNLYKAKRLDAGIDCQVNVNSNYMRLRLAGLPTSKKDASEGAVYVENGILKLNI